MLAFEASRRRVRGAEPRGPPCLPPPPSARSPRRRPTGLPVYGTRARTERTTRARRTPEARATFRRRILGRHFPPLCCRRAAEAAREPPTPTTAPRRACRARRSTRGIDRRGSSAGRSRTTRSRPGRPADARRRPTNDASPRASDLRRPLARRRPRRRRARPWRLPDSASGARSRARHREKRRERCPTLRGRRTGCAARRTRGRVKNSSSQAPLGIHTRLRSDKGHWETRRKVASDVNRRKSHLKSRSTREHPRTNSQAPRAKPRAHIPRRGAPRRARTRLPRLRSARPPSKPARVRKALGPSLVPTAILVFLLGNRVRVSFSIVRIAPLARRTRDADEIGAKDQSSA